MRIVCLSASNVKHKRENGSSLRICEEIKNQITEIDQNNSIKIVSLLDYKLTPCIFCGKCKDESVCAYDSNFNLLFDEFKTTDVIFLVIPHYMVIPSKLTIILEKLNQIYYTAWLRNPDEAWALKGKKIALIAHGGGDERSFDQYKNFILKPLNYVFSSFQFDVIGVNEEKPKGIVFGVKGMKDSEEFVFPDMIYDWDEIKQFIKPLVINAIQ
jgi:multimeric flavodoxin WrbA